MLECNNPSLSIVGLGHFHPENEMTNRFFEDLAIDTNEEWILERVGIRSRRTVLDLNYIRSTYNQKIQDADIHSQYTNADTIEIASKAAFIDAQIEPNKIGLVIAGGCSPQYRIPAESCIFSERLKINAPSIDINSACSSFIASLHFLSSMKESSLPDFSLICIAENTTRTVNYRDRSSAILWGDATSVSIIQKHDRIKERNTLFSGFRLRYTCFDSDPSGYDKVSIPNSAHFKQIGNHVQSFAIRTTLKIYSRLRELSKNPDRLFFIGHQANLSMLNSVCERAQIPKDLHLYNVDRFGNTGAAGIPSILSEYRHLFRPGDEIALVAVGSGLSWGGALIQYEDTGII